jgi:hypothetical protein
MKTPTMLVVAAFVAGALAMPATAMPQGHYSITFEYITTSYFDFKDGVGIADPADQDNPCTLLLLGLRGIQPIAETWEVDQNMGLNLNGPAVGISNLVPPLAWAGGAQGSEDPNHPDWIANSGGIPTPFDCPIPGSPVSTLGDPHNLWLVWSGVNWRSAQSDSSTEIHLCTQKTFPSSSPGCLPIPDSQNRLWASACNWNEANFGADYTDGKGKYLGGQPFDLLGLQSDQMKCNKKPHSLANQANDGWKRTVNYTDTIQGYESNLAYQTFDIIKNAAVVQQGDGPVYMAVCWDIVYYDFSKNDPVTNMPPLRARALTHDWKLILDVGLGGKKGGGPQEIIDALQAHYGGQQAGDQYVGGTNVALRGFYSDDAGNPKGTDFKGGTGVVGENGFPCKGPAGTPDAKKPSPII